MRKPRPLALAVLLAAIHGPAAAEPADSKVLATVNGKPITEDIYEMYLQQRKARAGDAKVDRDTIVKELVNIELVRQDAIKRGIDKRPQIARQLDWQARTLLVSAGMQDYLKNHPVSDEELEKAYQAEVAKMDSKEYKARHILLKTEEEARAVIAELDKGADFATLAKEKSTGPTGKKGGDLGWFGADRMVKPFGDAIRTMEKGSYTKEPVQTQFGWHVILLEDTRKMEPPSMDQVRKELAARLTNQRIDAYLDSLRKDAKIEIN